MYYVLQEEQWLVLQLCLMIYNINLSSFLLKIKSDLYDVFIRCPDEL